MLIKPGSETAFKKVSKKWSQKETKFIHEWTGQVELEAESGEKISDIIKRTTKNINDFNIYKFVNDLKKFWQYGEELYLYINKQKNIKEQLSDCGNSIYLSHHARKRMHERCGFNRTAQNKMAVLAYQKGVKLENTIGVIRSYLSKIILNTKEENALVRIYGDKTYVYKQTQNGVLLITVMQIPRLYIKYIKSENIQL